MRQNPYSLRTAHQRSWRKALSLLCTTMFSASSALSADCLDSEIVDNPDLSVLGENVAELNDLQQFKLRQVRYDFERVAGTSGRGELIKATETLTLDLTDFRNRSFDDAARQVSEAQDCNTSMRAHSFTLQPTPAGDLAGDMDVSTTIRSCTIFDRPCFRGLEWHSCREEWKTDLFSHTFGVKFGAKRVFLDDSKTLKIEYSTEFDRRGFDISKPLPNLLLNLTGIATFNIGSKWILDNYRSSLSDIELKIKQNIPESLFLSRNAPKEITELLKSLSLKDKFTYDSEKTKFTNSSAGSESNYLAFQNVTFLDPIRRNTFCASVRPWIRKYAAYLRSTTTGDQSVTVKEGERLWDIAEKFYGDGMFHITLLKPNDLPINQEDNLSVGQTINVPAMYKIWTGSDYPVADRDSLWKITKDRHGSVDSLSRIVEENKKFIRNPNLIYPAQLLDISPEQ